MKQIKIKVPSLNLLSTAPATQKPDPESTSFQPPGLSFASATGSRLPPSPCSHPSLCLQNFFDGIDGHSHNNHRSSPLQRNPSQTSLGTARSVVMGWSNSTPPAWLSCWFCSWGYAGRIDFHAGFAFCGYAVLPDQICLWPCLIPCWFFFCGMLGSWLRRIYNEAISLGFFCLYRRVMRRLSLSSSSPLSPIDPWSSYSQQTAITIKLFPPPHPDPTPLHQINQKEFLGRRRLKEPGEDRRKKGSDLKTIYRGGNCRRLKGREGQGRARGRGQVKAAPRGGLWSNHLGKRNLYEYWNRRRVRVRDSNGVFAIITPRDPRAGGDGQD